MKKRNKSQEIKRLKEWLQTVLPDDKNSIDVKKAYDERLSYEENKNKLIDKVNVLVNELKLQGMKKLYEETKEIEKSKAEAVKQAEKVSEKVDSKISKKLENKYKTIYRSVHKISQGYSHLLFVKGRAGIGKTTQLRNALKKYGLKPEKDYVEITGEVTEAYLYRLIYENNGLIIWLQDVSTLLKKLKNVNLLKAATETEKVRLLTKNNYSTFQNDLPDKFLCKSAFIFDYNSLNGTKLKEDFEALISRGDFKEIIFDTQEMKELMMLIAKTKFEKQITQLVVDEYKQNGLVRLNLRTQHKAIQTAKWAKKNKLDWQKEVLEDIKNVSEIRALLHSLIGEKPTKTTTLKKLLLKNKIVNSINTANRRIKEWIFLEELFVWDDNKRDYLVCINPKPIRKK